MSKGRLFVYAFKLTSSQG